MKQGTIEECIEQHKGLVYSTLINLRCVNSDEAQSVAFEALWRAIETFDSTRGTQFSTYAVKCIQNAVYSLFRKWKEIHESEVPLEDYLHLGSYDTYSFEIEEPTYAYVHEAVDDALKKFSGKKLIVINIWLESNMSATAIAKEAECSQSYVSQVLAEFRASLRKELINAGYTRDFTEDR